MQSMHLAVSQFYLGTAQILYMIVVLSNLKDQAMPLTPTDLNGVWDMVSFITTFENGSTLEPYGPAPKGRIIYTPDGTMAAHLWDPGRHQSGVPSNGDPSYFSYYGSWQLDGDHVHHYVIAAHYPDWAGSIQTRRIVPSGNHIELVADGVTFQGKTGRGVIRWQRI